MADATKPNPTIPELPDGPVSLEDVIQPLFESPIPDPAEFLRDEWYKVTPDSAKGQIQMLWLRYKQTAVALAVAAKRIIELEERIVRLEARQPRSKTKYTVH